MRVLSIKTLLLFLIAITSHCIHAASNVAIDPGGGSTSNYQYPDPPGQCGDEVSQFLKTGKIWLVKQVGNWELVPGSEVVQWQRTIDWQPHQYFIPAARGGSQEIVGDTVYVVQSPMDTARTTTIDKPVLPPNEMAEIRASGGPPPHNTRIHEQSQKPGNPAFSGYPSLAGQVLPMARELNRTSPLEYYAGSNLDTWVHSRGTIECEESEEDRLADELAGYADEKMAGTDSGSSDDLLDDLARVGEQGLRGSGSSNDLTEMSPEELAALLEDVKLRDQNWHTQQEILAEIRRIEEEQRRRKAEAEAAHRRLIAQQQAERQRIEAQRRAEQEGSGWGAFFSALVGAGAGAYLASEGIEVPALDMLYQQQLGASGMGDQGGGQFSAGCNQLATDMQNSFAPNSGANLCEQSHYAYNYFSQFANRAATACPESVADLRNQANAWQQRIDSTCAQIPSGSTGQWNPSIPEPPSQSPSYSSGSEQEGCPPELVGPECG